MNLNALLFGRENDCIVGEDPEIILVLNEYR
jgi:hypothetical protein